MPSLHSLHSLWTELCWVSASYPPRLPNCPPATFWPGWGGAGVSFPACSTAPGLMPSLTLPVVPASCLLFSLGKEITHLPLSGLSEGVSAPATSTKFVWTR